MNFPFAAAQREESRRTFFAHSGIGLGSLAMATLWDAPATTAQAPRSVTPDSLRPRQGHFPATAKNVIYLFMVGGPSHLDLFDYKPQLERYAGQPMPDSYVGKVKFEQIRDSQPLLMPSPWGFSRAGETGRYISNLLPETRKILDELSFIHTVSTEQSVHPHAQLLLLTGHRTAGRPSLGSWALYGLGSESEHLPGFIVLSSTVVPQAHDGILTSGFLSSIYHGVQLRGSGPPILDLNPPPGITPQENSYVVNAINELNAASLASKGDPEIAARISAYELAFRMQGSAPELVDLSDESQHTLDLYGVDKHQLHHPSLARECLLARRMVERGVRFVQVNLGDWDHHGSIEKGFPPACDQLDRPMAGLVQDLRQRGLLDDTLVIWGGEFGRTPVAQPQKTAPVGRDHLIESFTMWMVGGGVKPGVDLGATDELGFHAVQDPHHAHDVQATILHLLGLDHTKLTYRYQGRDFRLTDVYGNVMQKLLA